MPQHLLSALTGDPEIASLFSDRARLARLLAVEAALARAQGAAGEIPPADAEAIARLCSTIEIDRDALAIGLARDGVPIPELVRQLKAKAGIALAGSIHKGATSQDIVDTATALLARDINTRLGARLGGLLARLERIWERFGGQPLMAMTRMQDALPISVADKIASWKHPLEALLGKIAATPSGPLPLQLGGPVGNRASFAGMGDEIARLMAIDLGLGEHAPWHSDRRPVTRYGAFLAEIAGAVGKIGQDVMLLAHTRLGDVVIAGAGGSSAMAHKANPVQAELLVALARHAIGLAGTLQHALLHENERSGSAWTLEWLILPSLAEAVGGSTRIADDMLANLTFRSADPTPLA